MNTILHSDAVANLPHQELTAELATFLEPVTAQLPEKRLQEVSLLAVQGILGAKSPLITQIAKTLVRDAQTIRPLARRLYRFVWNERFSHRDLLKGLYGIAQRQVAEDQPERLVVAVDPVNFEKPYTEKLEGVSTVMKSTPPGRGKQKRLTSGYPAITACVVNLPVPVFTYANWFSYVMDFVSENHEIYRALRITRALFPERSLCFLGDAGLDDRKIFGWMKLVDAKFIIRAQHNRTVEVYNERLDRGEEELLDDLVGVVYLPLRMQVTFTHARKVSVVEKHVGWLKIRLPQTQQILWLLVAHDPEHDHDLVLLTNIPIHTAQDAQRLYEEWRSRPDIEHTYRFDQEAGLDVEDVRVQTLERMRRIFVLVLMAALFVYRIAAVWAKPAVLWLRRLGGKLGLPADCDGNYVLLAGIAAVFVTAATLAFVKRHPFPRECTCG